MLNTLFFAFWLILSLGLVYFMGWTMLIVHRQKQTWKAFSKKHKLRYKLLKGLLSPEVKGVYDGYTVSLFTGEHESEDIRGSRKMTAIEVNLNSKMPFAGAVASGQGMVQVVEDMGFPQEVVPKLDGWDKEYVAKSEKKIALREFLTDQRLKSLISLMKIKSTWVIFIFKDDTTLLRLDTPQPLDKIDILEKLMKKMIAVASSLELQDGESGMLKSAMNKEETADISIDIDEDDEVFLDAGLEIDEVTEENRNDTGPENNPPSSSADKSD